MKNRGYAASCRIKRLEQKDELESEKGKEFEDLDKMQVEIQVTTLLYFWNLASNEIAKYEYPLSLQINNYPNNSEILPFHQVLTYIGFPF